MPSAGLLFKAMADPTRERLLRVLSVHDLSVSELVEVLDQPQSTISRHLRVLCEAGLVVDRRHRATVVYAAHPPGPPHIEGESGADQGFGGGGLNGVEGTAALRGRLLEWVGREQLNEGLNARLQRVMNRRRANRANFFETVGARWDQLRIEAFGEAFHLEALTALLPEEWTVADVGTGTGYLLGVLSRRFRKVIAIEPAGAMLEAARARSELKPARNVVFRAGSLADLPLETGEVDLAIASLVLHHVARPPEALRELRRCLRAGGRLMLIEQQAHRNAAFHDRMGDHWWGFTPAKLTRWASAAGFTGVQSEPLVTARPTARQMSDAPPLLVLTAKVGKMDSGGGPRRNAGPVGGERETDAVKPDKE